MKSLSLLDLMVLSVAIGLAIYFCIILKDCFRFAEIVDFDQNEEFFRKTPIFIKNNDKSYAAKTKVWFKLLIKKRVTINEAQNRIYIM